MSPVQLQAQGWPSPPSACTGLGSSTVGNEGTALWGFILTSPLFSLQSSGNVWVTHEEMENLATSTKTVRLPGPTARHISYCAELRACINTLTLGGKEISAASRVSALGQHHAAA